MKCFAVLVSANLLIAGSLGAANVDVSKLPPPSRLKGVTYAKDIHPLFQASCVRCHSGERPKHGLRLDTLQNALKGDKDGKVILPGDSAKSKLVIAVARINDKTAMPPKPHPNRRGRGGEGHGEPPGPSGWTNRPAGEPHRDMRPPPKPLTPEQVGLVRAWIDEGAK
jgi:hypothetical protein